MFIGILSTPPTSIEDICLDPFDVSLRRPCVTLSWQPRFFYNVSAQRCQMFWYDESCEANVLSYKKCFRRVYCHGIKIEKGTRVRRERERNVVENSVKIESWKKVLQFSAQPKEYKVAYGEGRSALNTVSLPASYFTKAERVFDRNPSSSHVPLRLQYLLVRGCNLQCLLIVQSHIMRHGARSKAVGKITAMFTRDNSTTPSLRVDRTLSNSISAKTSLPRFVVSAKLTKYPTTKSDNRNMQSSRMIYFSQHHSFEASSTRLPIRLGKISVTHTEYSESDMTSRLHMNTYEVMTTARTIYEVELPTTTGHPNKIDENAVSMLINSWSTT
uniref:BPTI/Kunitz inhibitor domain-containing protein n=1 Tax=Parascaris equorum TaxID=6256 RepID=A0A914S2G3_PAREQ